MTTPYVTLRELARVLRIPAAWLRRETAAGRLPHLAAGRRALYDVEAVRRSLSERTDASRAEPTDAR